MPKRKHQSSSSAKSPSDKGQTDKPSKCKLRVQEVQDQFEVKMCQMKEHLIGECLERSNQQDAKIEFLKKQLALEQSKTKHLQNMEKLHSKTIRDLQSIMHRMSVKLEQIVAGRYEEVTGTPERLPISSFMAVTPSTTNRDESENVVMQIPGIRAFRGKNEDTSQQVLIVDVDNSINASILFEPTDQQNDGGDIDQRTMEDNGRNSHGSLERITSWMEDARDHLVDSQLDDQNGGDGLSMLEQVLEEEEYHNPHVDPLADSWADFPQSISDNEGDRRLVSPVRRPMTAVDQVKNERMQKSVTTSKQTKEIQKRVPKGQQSMTINGKRTWTGTKKCYVCRTSTRRVCSNHKCGLPVCKKESENRNYCKNYNPGLGACYRKVDGRRTLVTPAEDVCSQMVDGKRVFRKKSEKGKPASEQGRCEDCKFGEERWHQKVSRTRCDCCCNFYCKDHRAAPVVECIKHREEMPGFTTDTDAQSSVYEDYEYRSDAMSTYRSPPKRTSARLNSPKRRFSTSSSVSNASSTPQKKPRVSELESSGSGYRHSVPLPKELQRHSYMLTRINHKYGL